jgi:hypothetical protein
MEDIKLEILNWHWKIGDTVVLLEPDYEDKYTKKYFENIKEI